MLTVVRLKIQRQINGKNEPLRDFDSVLLTLNSINSIDLYHDSVDA